MSSVEEEALREAACVGNLEELDSLVKSGVDVNSTNKVNGWTALHWASKRGHLRAVEALLEAGADKSVQNTQNEVASDLTTNEKIRALLGAPPLEKRDGEVTEKPSFVPNYLANPQFVYSRAKHHDSSKPLEADHSPVTGNGFLFHPTTITCTKGNQWSPSGLVLHPDVIVFCVRLATITALHRDFVEVEISRHEAPTLEKLTEILCNSLDLGVKPEYVQKIRKLPETVLKCDKDVLRLTDYQKLEIVLQPDALHPFDGAVASFDRSGGAKSDTKYLKDHVSKLIY